MDAWDELGEESPDAEALAERVVRWAGRNTWSRNPAGVAGLAGELAGEFAALGAEAALLDLPPWEWVNASGQVEAAPLGPALRARRRPEAPLRVLLVAHLDTVFPPEHPFRSVTREGRRLRGPGVADCKGGVAVLLAALGALEASPWAANLGWEAWLAPDEELGSPGSGPLLLEAAGRCDLGLVFEPGLPDGALVAGRKGSGNVTAVVRGRSAHAGRNPEEGRNAIHALAAFVVDLVRLDGQGDGITVNVGRVEGGEAANVVPGLALARFNVRLASAGDQVLFEAHLAAAAASVRGRDGIGLELHGAVARPPWQPDSRSGALRGLLDACAARGGRELAWRTTGGASDANLLAAAGLPVADGLGPWGEGLHTDREALHVASLGERARLAALLLRGLASGALTFPREE